MTTEFINIDFDSRAVNSDFIIVVTIPRTPNSRRRRYACGVCGLFSLVGDKLANRLIKRAYAANSDKFTSSLRRGITIQFYSH